MNTNYGIVPKRHRNEKGSLLIPHLTLSSRLELLFEPDQAFSPVRFSAIQSCQSDVDVPPPFGLFLKSRRIRESFIIHVRFLTSAKGKKNISILTNILSNGDRRYMRM